MKSQFTGEDEVRKVLSELRNRNKSAEVDEDIKTLEKVLENPIFRRFSQKSTSSMSNGPRKQKLSELPPVNDGKKVSIQKHLQPRLLHLVRENQKLLFAYIDYKKLKPEVLETNEENKRLLIVGPPDIKFRSLGRIRVADRILAVDHQTLLWPLSLNVDSENSDNVVNSSTTIGAASSTPQRQHQNHQQEEHQKNHRNQQNTGENGSKAEPIITNSTANSTTVASHQASPDHLYSEEIQKSFLDTNELSSSQNLNADNAFNGENQRQPNSWNRNRQNISIPKTGTGLAATDTATAAAEDVSLRCRNNTALACDSALNNNATATTTTTPLLKIYEQQVAVAEQNNHPVILTLLREATPMVLVGDRIELQIIQLPNEPGIGLGFGIVGGASTGVVVKTILPGSPADKGKELRPGDHILKVGAINVQGMGSQQVATILRQQAGTVELVVGRQPSTKESSLDAPNRWTMLTRDAMCTRTLQEEIDKRMYCMASTSQKALETSDLNDSVATTYKAETYTDVSSADGTSSSPPYTVPSEKPESDSQAEIDTKVEKGCQECQQSEDIDAQIPSTSSAFCELSPQAINDAGSTEEAVVYSYHQLSEMAPTLFKKEKWINGKYELIEVTLSRDPVLGLGITLVGYVHSKVEIRGVFVKSVVPNSSAYYTKKIRLHDLILEVDGRSLEDLNHDEAVRSLMKSGSRVKLKLIRFHHGTPQEQCLKMLQEQETATQVFDMQTTLVDVVAEWKKKLGVDFDVISVDLIPDKCEDGGLGITIEGTVDVVDGAQLCPHHYIGSLRPGGPAANSNSLRSGDELLQANDVVLYGESHVTVRQALSKAASRLQWVRLTVARKAQTVNVFVPQNYEKSLPVAYPLLAASDDRLVKAKSDTCLSLSCDNTATLLEQVSERLRSRSLQPFSGLAIWKCVPIVVYLEKDSKGLGFSVVDYRDPVHQGQSVIVVRSLVPGGVAQADGRIVPGDRLMYVNNEDLSNSTLDHAVAVLKSAPQGVVRLGIAKPVPIEQCGSTRHSPIFSRGERVIAKETSPRLRRRHKEASPTVSSQEEIWIGGEDYRKRYFRELYPSLGSLTPSTSRSHASLSSSYLSMSSWSPCSTRSVSPCGSPLQLRGSWGYDVVYLPSSLERSIKIAKGPLSLGLVLDASTDKGINGCVVKSICGKKAVGKDGRIQVGDYIVKVNMENLRNVTTSQARSILKRANLIGVQCNITYITASDAKLWRERYHQETELPPINRLSPKVFPKFYRSPYIDRKPVPPPNPDDSFDDDLPSTSISISQGFDTSSDTEHFDFQTFVSEIVQAVLRDTYLELSMAATLSDWKKHSVSADRNSQNNEKQEEIDTLPSTSGDVLAAQEEKAIGDSTKQISFDAELSKEVGKENTESTLVTTEAGNTSTSIESFDQLTAKETLAKQELKLAVSSTSPSSASEITKDLEDAPSTSKLLEVKKEIVPAEVHFSADIENLSEEKSVEKTSKRIIFKTQSDTTPKQHRLERLRCWGEEKTVILERAPGQSFGISIVGGRVQMDRSSESFGTGTVTGIFIKSVLPDSPAGNSGLMNMGDRLLSVNDQDLRNATHEQAVHLIKNATNPVKFVVQSLYSVASQNSAGISSSGSIRERSPKPGIMFIPDELRKRNSKSSTPEVENVSPKLPEPKDEKSPIKDVLKSEKATIVSGVKSQEVQKPQSENLLPKTKQEVKDEVAPLDAGSIGSTADRPTAVTAKSKDNEVKSPNLENTASGLTREEHRSSKKLASSVGESERKKHRESVRQKLDKDSAAFLEKLPDDEEEDLFCYTRNKIMRKYNDLDGDKLLLKLNKVPPGGLGLSLAGNKERGKTSVFVVGVRSTCPLPIEVGDELLEVNGKVLYGLSHLNASAKIRECCEAGALELLLRRHNSAGEPFEKSEPKLYRSETSPVFPYDKTVIPGSRKNSIEEKRDEQELSDKTAKSEVANDAKEVIRTMEEHHDGISRKISNGKHGAREEGLSQIASTAQIETGRETLIEIDKEGKGLGLSIVGGADTVLGTVVIHEVYPDGAAATDGRLKPGDQVLEVNGVSLRGVEHEQAISILRRTPSKVQMKVFRDLNIQLSVLDPTQIYNIMEVELIKKAGRGFGLSIVGRKDEPGVYISEIVKGGVAEMDGRLLQGDQILAVNGADVTTSMQEDVAAMLKACVGPVCLKVGRWKLSETTGQKQKFLKKVAVSSQDKKSEDKKKIGVSLDGSLPPPEIRLYSPTSENKELPQIVEEGSDSVPPPSLPSRPSTIPTLLIEEDRSGIMHSDLSPVTEEPSSSIDQRSMSPEEEKPGEKDSEEAEGEQKSSPEPVSKKENVTQTESHIEVLPELFEECSETLMIQLKKQPDQQLGMGIGKRNRGILVTSLQPGSVAAEKLRIGDRIMAVNGLLVTDQMSAVTLIKASGMELWLQIARPHYFIYKQQPAQ